MTTTGLSGQLRNHLESKGYSNFELIGSGGMGTVVHAHHEALGRDAAIKILNGDGVSPHVAGKRFHAEMRMMAHLDHPSIVRVYDGGVADDGTAYYVMAFVAGTDLACVIDRRKKVGKNFTVREVVQYLAPIARAMDYLAQQRPPIVHRDIKPANILVPAKDWQPQSMLTDFGIAINDDLTRMTGEGVRIGTAAYQAPELFTSSFQANPPEATPASDRYALALIALEMITLARLYNQQTPEQWAHRRVTLKIKATDVAETDRAFAKQINQILQVALSEKPERRPSSAQQLIDELAAIGQKESGSYAAGTPGQAPRNNKRIVPSARIQPRAMPTQQGAVPETRLQTRASPQPQERQARNRIPRGILAGVGVLGVLVVGAWTVFGGSNTEEWGGSHQDLAETFPAIISDAVGATGWNGTQCTGAQPEANQDARIVCRGNGTTVVAADYGDGENRDAVVPEGNVDKLASGECSVRSAQINDNTWAMYPEGEYAQYAFLVSGEHADELRLRLPICS